MSDALPGRSNNDPPMSARVYCQVCLSFHNVEEVFTLSECSHSFCRSCLAGYLQTRIGEGALAIPCFYMLDAPVHTISNDWTESATSQSISSVLASPQSIRCRSLTPRNGGTSTTPLFRSSSAPSLTDLRHNASITREETTTEFGRTTQANKKAVEEGCANHTPAASSRALTSDDKGGRQPRPILRAVEAATRALPWATPWGRRNTLLGVPGEGGPRDAQSQQERPTGICGKEIRNWEIESLVEESDWHKFVRFGRMRKNPSLRECPKCSFSQLGDKSQPQLTCESCGFQYCYFHGEAHTGTTCASFIARTRRLDRPSEALIRHSCQPCPTCQMAVQKSGGCNQMVCTYCETSFCWLCGQLIGRDLFPAHFAWWNTAGCAGQQMTNSDRPMRGKWGWWFRLLIFVGVVSVGPIALVLTIATLPIVLCWKRHTWRGAPLTVFTFWGNIIICILWIPLFLTYQIFNAIFGQCCHRQSNSSSPAASALTSTNSPSSRNQQDTTTDDNQVSAMGASSDGGVRLTSQLSSEDLERPTHSPTSLGGVVVVESSLSPQSVRAGESFPAHEQADLGRRGSVMRIPIFFGTLEFTATRGASES